MKLIFNVIFFVFTLSISAQTLDTFYVYDNLNRVTQVTYNDGTIIDYSYDDLGNRSQKIITPFVAPQLTFVPDDNFEQELINLGYDDVMDDYVITDNINSLLVLDLFGLNIEDLTGIEDFVALENLDIGENQISQIVLTENTNLINLAASFNDANLIDVTQNILLQDLSCVQNNLNEIDLSNNINLININVDSNPLTSLDISNNTQLVQLYANDCGLFSIDVTNNPLIEWIDMRDNQLSVIDLSQNQNLINLNLWENNLNVLDLSQNPELEYLIIPSNNLSELNLINNNLIEVLDIKLNEISNLDVSNLSNLRVLLGFGNSITSLDFSNNSELTWISVSSNNLNHLNVNNGNNGILNLFSSIDNPNLFCIQVDDENAANNGGGVYEDWNKDQQAVYSEDCTLGIIENQLAEFIEISPNPTSSFVNIIYSENVEVKTISVFDINGRELQIFEKNISTISLANYNSGVYLIEFVDSNNKKGTFRVIKN